MQIAALDRDPIIRFTYMCPERFDRIQRSKSVLAQEGRKNNRLAFRKSRKEKSPVRMTFRRGCVNTTRDLGTGYDKFHLTPRS